jgi:prepilin peptidase CpaA
VGELPGALRPLGGALGPPLIAFWAVVLTALVFCAITDLLYRRIFNAVTYPLAALALGVHGVVGGLGDPDHGLVSSLIGLALAFVLFAILSWRGSMGWGDTKLMVAVGAALGYPLVLAAMVFISLAGAAQAIVSLAWTGESRGRAAAGVARLVAKLRLPPPVGDASKRHIPYGVAIAVGAMFALWWRASGRG